MDRYCTREFEFDISVVDRTNDEVVCDCHFCESDYDDAEKAAIVEAIRIEARANAELIARALNAYVNEMKGDDDDMPEDFHA